MFFELMVKIPRSIITDQQYPCFKSLEVVIKKLKIDTIHMLDQFHQLKAIRKKLPKEKR